MKTLIIPGWYGSQPGHWQSWWLETQPDAHLVVQADWARPSLDAWAGTLADAARANPGAVLVAHSLGAALVAHLAVRHPGLPVAGALLVAPADVDDRNWTSPELAGFGPMPARPLPFPAIVVASRNDPYVAFGRAEAFARGWHADLVDLGEAGHINADAGFGPWPEGPRLAARLLDRPADPAPVRPAESGRISRLAARAAVTFRSPPLPRRLDPTRLG